MNAEDYAGLTPLHLAAAGGHIDTVDYLLKNGSLVHKIDSFGHSPLYVAVKCRYVCISVYVRVYWQVMKERAMGMTLQAF